MDPSVSSYQATFSLPQRPKRPSSDATMDSAPDEPSTSKHEPPCDDSVDDMEIDDETSTTNDSENNPESEGAHLSDDDYSNWSSDNPDIADPPWDPDPSRHMILNLMAYAEFHRFGDGGEFPLAARRIVVQNAMTSVQLLEHLGEDIVTSKGLGIDYAGRPCRLGPSDKNYRQDFGDLVASVRKELARELGLRKPREAIKQKMKAYIRANEEAPLPKGRCLLIKHRDLEAMLCLRELVLDTFFGWLSGINNLHSVLDQCEEAVSELKSIISPITAVRQDLVDKGTSDRWDDMRKTMPPVRLTAEAKEMRQNNNVDGLIGTMTSDLMPYQSVLERTIKLGDDLRAAIEEFAPLSEPVTSREERLQNQVLMAPLPPDIFAMWDPEEEDGQRVWDDGRGTRSPGWYTDEESE